MANSDTEVAIVGGGAAGIAAGRRLAAAGIACTIVEARARLGGRAWTQATGGFALDFGCGWLHSADRNPWVEVATGQGRSIDKSAPPWARSAIPAGFPVAEQDDFSDALDEFFARLEAAAKHPPDAAAATLLVPGERWNSLIGAIGTYITGGELERVSILDFDRYADNGVNWRVREGYGATIAAYGDGLSVLFDCPVTRIDHSGKRLRIETAKGAIGADRVIVTLPSAVIAETETLFAPALPEKTRAARGLPLGLADKLFLSLEGAEEFAPDSRLFGRTDTAATATYHLRPFGRPLIEVYFGGHFAAELEAGGAEAFYDYAASELAGLLGSGFRRRVKLLAMHCWGADAFARGSYSFALPGQADRRAVLAAPVDGRLFFAGEACSTHDFSTAHGGFRTGVAAAEQVIAARKS